MRKVKILIIGGGASGLFCALALCSTDLLVLEKKDRVGKKLSATGNGQGNVSNVDLTADKYFSVRKYADKKVENILDNYGYDKTIGFLEEKGGLFASDERGRVYPSGKQASAVTDLFRYCLESQGKKVVTDCAVTKIKKANFGFEVTARVGEKEEKFCASNVVFACGGKASPSFGSDGSAYQLLKDLGHSVTPLYPSLVQLKTDVTNIKGLKGIRVFATLTVKEKDNVVVKESGDLIFTDYGISGDAVFRLSAFVTEKAEKGIDVDIDLLPDQSEENLIKVLNKRVQQKIFCGSELLCGLLPNALGRAVIKRAGCTDTKVVAKLVKKFTLKARGTLGFDYAQVTKGGIPLDEVSECLESKFAPNLFITGEALDVDGQCGGYNLQWAFSSACAVAETINKR